MNIEEIKKNKPNGATHYMKPLYYKNVDGVWFYYDPSLNLWFESLSAENKKKQKKQFNPSPL